MSPRNLAGGAFVALGLILASFAWSGFSLTRTVFNPSRSEEIARHLYNDPFVKEFLEDRMAQAVANQIPLELGVANRDIKTVAASALASVEGEEAFVNALGSLHRQLIGMEPQEKDSVVVTSAALGEQVRTGLGRTVPGLGDTVPSLDSFAVDLPVDSLPSAGGWRNKLTSIVNLLALAAVVLVGTAFVITNNRAKILRRVGFWAIGAAAFWLVLAVVVPVAAPVLLPEKAALLGGFWGVAAEGMRLPSIVAMGLGVTAVVVSFVWGTVARFVGVGSISARGRRQAVPTVSAASYPQPPLPSAGTYPPMTQGPVSSPGGPTRSYAPPTAAPVAPPGQGVGHTGPPSSFPTSSLPTSSYRPPTPPEESDGPRWVEGQGYVDD